MAINDPPPSAAPTEPAVQHFALTVQPGTPHHAWRARLQADGGSAIDFASPIELLRHLAQLGSTLPPPGALK